jgi:hypothetical protein
VLIYLDNSRTGAAIAVAPVNVVPPSITGPAAVDSVNTLDIGSWTGALSYVINIYSQSTGGSVVLGPYNPFAPPPTIRFIAGTTYWIEVTATGTGGTTTTVRTTSPFGPVSGPAVGVIANSVVIQGSSVTTASTITGTGLTIPAHTNGVVYIVVAAHYASALSDNTETVSNVRINGGTPLTKISGAGPDGSVFTQDSGVRRARFWVFAALDGDVPRGTSLSYTADRSATSAAAQFSVQVMVLENVPQTLIAATDIKTFGSTTLGTSYTSPMTMPANALALCFWGSVSSNTTAETISVGGNQTLVGSSQKSTLATTVRSTLNATAPGSYTFSHTTQQNARLGAWITLPVLK